MSDNDSQIAILTEKVETVDTKVEHLTGKIDKIANVIIGDPSDTSKPGHSIRLDRLEQKHKIFVTLLGMIGTVCFAIIISMAVGHFIG